MIRKKVIFLIVPILLIIAAVALSFATKQENAEERIRLTAFASEDLAYIEFLNQEDSWQLIKREDWQVRESAKTDADAAEGIVKKLVNISGKLIAENEKSEMYGFAPPSATVTFVEKNGDKTVLYLGNKTPAGTEYYVKNESGRIYTVYTEVGNAMKSQRYQAEDSFIFGVRYEELYQIQVGGQMPFTLTKEDGCWNFVCGEYREDIATELIKSGVTRHFGAMYALRTQKATEERKNFCGFQENGDTVMLIDYNGEKHTVFLGGNDDECQYIMVDDGDEIYSVISDCFDFIQLYRENAM